MKIETITLSNFRCFGADPVVISLQENLTALVGNNGSGKTAVFMALARLFGTSAAQRALRKSDFHIEGNQDTLRSETELAIDCVLGFPELDGNDDEGTDAVPEALSHMATDGENGPLKVRIRLQAKWIDNGTTDGIIEESVRWVQSLDNEFEWDDCRPVQNVERNFIQLVYVPASRNAADQVTALLKGRLWRAAKWSNGLADSAAEAAGKLQKDFEEEDPSAFILDRLEKRWTQLHQADTDRKPKLRLIDSTLEDLVRRAEFVFFPDEAGQARSLDDLSDGQRSLFHIALTAAVLEIERDALALAADESMFDQEKLRRTYLTILAIEEPENSLSPFFLSRIMTQAREIGELDTAQILISSHSASILSRVEPEEVRYARLDHESRSSSIRSLSLPDDDEDAQQYVRLAVRAYPELYFGRFVILAEGDSEAIILPRLAEAKGFPLDRSFVPIVPLGGRYVRHFWRLLSGLQIPYATLLDLDLGRKHGGSKVIATTIAELNLIGRDLTKNVSVVNGEVNLADIDDIVDSELLAEGQDHPWLKMLRREAVYFSSPIDVDFAMLRSFAAAYQHARPGGRGPRRSAQAIKDKKSVTLKTDGNPDLYNDAEWSDAFVWYPYLFLSDSKPGTHIEALTRISDEDLADDAPIEFKRLLTRVKKALNL